MDQQVGVKKNYYLTKIEECLQAVQNHVESSFNNIDAYLDQILNSASDAIDINYQNSLQTVSSEYIVNFPSPKLENICFAQQLCQDIQPLIKSNIKNQPQVIEQSLNEQQNIQVQELKESTIQECQNENSEIQKSMESKISDKDEEILQEQQNLQFSQIGNKQNILKSKIISSIYQSKMKPFNYQQIQDYSFSQNEICLAIALNKDSSTLVAGARSQIKVFEFTYGVLKHIQNLNEHKNTVFTLNFMKKSNNFISGSRDGTIIIWQKTQNILWNTQQILNGHSSQINCLVINNTDDLFFSGSDDKTIKIWKRKNEWLNQQTIKDHSKSVYGLSLNQQSNRLISCGFDKFILIREQSELNKEWIVIQKLPIEQDGYRICFIDDNIFVFSPFNTEKLQVFEMNEINKQFTQTKDINVKCESDGQSFFPLQYINSNCILICKNGEFVNLIRKKQNGEFVTEQSIHFQTNSVFGRMSDDGQYLITWDNKSNQIQIRTSNEL